ncbi:hypothetical protein UCREL1_7850 [Eutypa lata UCREL1]|uniref:Uncharacterized protein n=1 Tax=Eutypa lata (strain UCR-EL1) TaxID=1287681 RepID=M7TER6_EUTLA|nr:hypothetical protein UCREL1_7850 [Eutypa lata UCREL1]
MPRATAPHASAVATDWPPLQVLFHWATPAPRKQPAATPLYADTALIRSGYVAASTLAIIAPLEPPVTYTRSGSAAYSAMANLIMLPMAVLSPPPSRVSDCVDDTSQHVPLFGDDGHTVTYPFPSDPCFHGIAAFWKYDCAVDWHECSTITSGVFSTTLSGT